MLPAFCSLWLQSALSTVRYNTDSSTQYQRYDNSPRCTLFATEFQTRAAPWKFRPQNRFTVYGTNSRSYVAETIHPIAGNWLRYRPKSGYAHLGQTSLKGALL